MASAPMGPGNPPEMQQLPEGQGTQPPAADPTPYRAKTEAACPKTRDISAILSAEPIARILEVESYLGKCAAFKNSQCIKATHTLNQP